MSIAESTAGRPQPGDPLLRATGLRKVFPNGVRAVDDVDLSVDAGETVPIETVVGWILRPGEPVPGSGG